MAHCVQSNKTFCISLNYAVFIAQGSVNEKTTALPQCISELQSHRSYIKSGWRRMGWWFVFWFLLYSTYDIIKSAWLY